MTGYTKDLFISYAHIDNQPLNEGASGWVSRFHTTLQALLSMRLGHTARIWRDEKLQGNDIFSDEILDQFKDTAVLVSVLTPRYLNSEWCTKEITEFCAAAERNGGVVLNNKARLFKVLKTPVESQDGLPPVAQDVLGYNFFDYENDVPIEYDPAFGEQYAQALNRMVAQVASDLSSLLRQLQPNPGAPEAPPDNDKLTIYLAECSYDQKETRDILTGELRQHGYTILPDRPLPLEESEYIKAVKSMLDKSDLSIHLVGDTYGAVPDGPTQKSVTEFQNELGVSKSINTASEFKRFIWLPAGSSSSQPQQQAFIDALHHDAITQFGADLITSNFESFKSALYATLDALEEKDGDEITPSGDTADSNEKLVYLICDSRDRKATVPIRKFLRDKGLEVKLPTFEGDATTVRKHHLELIKSCDAILLYYGTGDEAWKRTFDLELKKLPGYRGDKPLLAKYTYLAGPDSDDKHDMIDMEEPNVIDGLLEFSANAMDQFMEELLQEKEALQS